VAVDAARRLHLHHWAFRLQQDDGANILAGSTCAPALIVDNQAIEGRNLTVR
jgi:hypothetical protein